MPLSLMIGGVERAQDVNLRSLAITSALTSQVDTADFDVVSGLQPIEGEEVVIQDDDGREFGGQIVSSTQVESVPGDLRFGVHCVDWTRKADARFVNETYVDKTRGEIARDIVAKYCPGFTASVDNVPNGPRISGEYRITYKKASQVFRELCSATSGDWYWDPYAGLHLFDADDATAPFRLSDDGGHDAEHPADLTWIPDISDLATRVYVRGGDYFPQTAYPQTIRCDGVARAWFLAYKPKDLQITVAGVPQVVAVDDLINQPVGADFTFNFQEKLLKRAPDKPTPADGTLLELSYRPFLPVRLRLDDTEAQTRMASLDGSDGVYEATVVDESLDSIEQARAVGQAYLKEHADPIVTGGYTTLLHGLRSGQTQSVQMAARGIDTQILIGSVTKRRLPGGRWRSQVVFASRLIGGVEDLILKLLRSSRTIEIRNDEILEIVQAFKSTAQSSDVMTVTAGPPAIAQVESSRADRCEVV